MSREDLEKMLPTKVIKSIDYLEWNSNVLPITKPFSEIKIYTDLRDLNKDFPKDNFPLPNIEMRCCHSWKKF